MFTCGLGTYENCGDWYALTYDRVGKRLLWIDGMSHRRDRPMDVP